MPLILNRMVNIIEIDGHKHQEFNLTFIENRQIMHTISLPMGPRMLEMVQHWLSHDDILFNDMKGRR